jgi:hypothetical protein
MNSKAVLTGAILLGTGIGISLLRKRSQNTGKGLTVGIYTVGGQLIAQGSTDFQNSLGAAIASLAEGSSYVVKATVTNTSKKGTVPVEAYLYSYLTASTEKGTIVDRQLKVPADGSNLYAAGAAKQITWASFTIPVSTETAQYTGTVLVEVKTADGVSLAIKSVSVPVTVTPITYGATITDPQT